MKELLERWSITEPNRCRAYGPNETGRDKGEEGFQIRFYQQWRYATDTNDTQARIQIAVQQAIEARGWLWGRDPIGKTYQIIIPTRGYSSEYWDWVEGHDTLLSAYLMALESINEEAAA